MLAPLRLPGIIPAGAGVELVDDDDLILMRCPLVIEGSPSEVEVIYGKFWGYRIWHKLKETQFIPGVMPATTGGQLADTIQEHYLFSEGDPGFSSGIESVTVVYPKVLQPRVTRQLSHFPPRLSLVAGSSITGASQSIHVQGRTGTKSLAVLEQPLDIDVPDQGVFLLLNNPVDPSWVVTASRNRSPIRLFARREVLNEHEISERAAWEQVESWLRSRGLSVYGKQYPEGKNAPPDYRAWIEGVEYDVEMTSVPDMEKWTLKSKYRDLEKRISEVAKQAGETMAEVVDALRRVLSKKRESLDNMAEGNPHRPRMLVVSNWSAHELADEPHWPQEHVSAFDVVMLVELDGVYRIRWRGSHSV